MSNETDREAATDRSQESVLEYLRRVVPGGLELENVDDSDLLPLDDPLRATPAEAPAALEQARER